MNVSQSNLYEILDALQVSAYVGEGCFEIKEKLRVDNGYIEADIKITGLYIHETQNSMYAIMRIGDLGLVIKSGGAQLRRVTLLDLTIAPVDGYIEIEDYVGLLTSLDHDQWKSTFVVGDYKC
jgi:hypothetical protein